VVYSLVELVVRLVQEMDKYNVKFKKNFDSKYRLGVKLGSVRSLAAQALQRSAS